MKEEFCSLEKKEYYNPFLIDYNRFVFTFVDIDKETQL